MKLHDARALALSLMNTHGLIDKGWAFTFDNAPKRLGLCTYLTRTISMGRVYVLAADEESVRQTMLHEIAHALVGPTTIDRYGRPQKTNHGPLWKQKAREIGHTGAATGQNPHVANQDAAIIARARALAPTVAHVTSGPLRMGERVATACGRHSGLMLNTLRTRGRFLDDNSGQVYLSRLTNLVRTNGAHARAGVGPGAATRKPLPALAPEIPTAEFCVGDTVTVHRPGSKYHGLVGIVAKVNPVTYRIALIDRGSIVASKSLVRSWDYDDGDTFLTA